MLEEVDTFQVLVSALILQATIESSHCFIRMKITDSFQLTRKVIKIVNININDKNKVYLSILGFWGFGVWGF